MVMLMLIMLKMTWDFDQWLSKSHSTDDEDVDDVDFVDDDDELGI